MDEKSIREIIREEWEKLSRLSWGERLVYIWDYYKPLMAAIGVIILVISMGVSIYHNLQINTLISAYFINCNSYEADGDAIAAEFAEYIGGLEEHDEVHVDTMTTLDDEDMSQYGTANQMKITAYLAAGEIDVALLDQTAYDKYDGTGAFCDLREIFTEEDLEKWSDLLVYGVLEESAETEESAESESESSAAALEEVPVALNVQNAPVVEKYNAYYGEKVYAVVMVNSKNQGNAAEFLNFLMTEAE